jgi:hypothetical protein
MFDNSALSRIQSEEGQLKALSLMVEHAKVLQTVISDKDALKQVGSMLSNFDKKHAEVHEMLNEKALRDRDLEERQAALDAQEKRLAEEHVARTAELDGAHRVFVQQHEEKIAKDQKYLADVHASRMAKVDELERAVSSRESSVRRAELASDLREKALNEHADRLGARQAELEARHDALTAFSAKVEARHEEVSAAEKNALRG